MMEKCFDEGTIQAFLDGELGNDLLEQVARHISLCHDCALLLAEAENESALAFTALDGELNLLVPTERIRTNLYERIAEEKKPFWQKIFSNGFNFSFQSIAAFASLALVFGITAGLFLLRENNVTSDVVARNETPRKPEPQITGKQSDPVSANPVDEVPVINPQQARVVRPSIERNRATLQNADYRVQRSVIKPNVKDNSAVIQPAKDESLAGEESYLKTIAALTENVNSRKDEVLRPSARVAFESDLAIVSNAITKIQGEVRKNPKNEAAKELLRSSYQNKIDLLNSVAEKTELMATVR